MIKKMWMGTPVSWNDLHNNPRLFFCAQTYFYIHVCWLYDIHMFMPGSFYKSRQDHPFQSRCLFAHKAQFFLKQILKKAHPTFSITPDGVNVGFSYSLSMFASSEFLYIGPFIGMKVFYKQTKS